MESAENNIMMTKSGFNACICYERIDLRIINFDEVFHLTPKDSDFFIELQEMLI